MPFPRYVLYHIAGYLAVIPIGRLRFLCAAAHGFNSHPAGQGVPEPDKTRDDCASHPVLSGISSSVCAIEQPTSNWYLRFLCAADVPERRDRIEGSFHVVEPGIQITLSWKWMLIAQWRGEACGLDNPGRPTIAIKG